MSEKKRKHYTLDELIKHGGRLDPAVDPWEGLTPDSLATEWPNDAMQPFAYRVISCRGDHIAVLPTRAQAHAVARNEDPKLNSIYAVYPDGSEKMIQGGLSILETFDGDDFEQHWRKVMEASGIDKSDIELTLNFYQKYDGLKRG